MLETIHEYAQEQLVKSGEEEAIRRAHAAFFLALAEQAEPDPIGPRQQEWLDRLEREHDNLRAALAWSLARDDAPTALRIGAAVWCFWHVRGHAREGRDWLARALAGEGAAEPAIRAQAHRGAAIIAEFLGETSTATAHYAAALTAVEQAGDTALVASIAGDFGGCLASQGNFERARSLCERAVAIGNERGDARLLERALNHCGNLANRQGNYELVSRLFEQSLHLARSIGAPRSLARVITNLSLMRRNLGQPETALPLSQEAVALFRELRDPGGLVFALVNLADVHDDLGHPARTAELWEEALVIGRRSGHREGGALALATWPIWPKCAAIWSTPGGSLARACRSIGSLATARH